jgi:hypothetical protein
MANLKQDLEEYMLMQDDRKANKISYKMPNLKLPSFLRNSSDGGSSTSNSWLNDNNEDDSWSCCPKLNRCKINKLKKIQ